MPEIGAAGQLQISSSLAMESIVVLIAFGGAVERIDQRDQTKSDQKKHSFSYALSLPQLIHKVTAFVTS
jgi:hypothetical protein